MKSNNSKEKNFKFKPSGVNLGFTTAFAAVADEQEKNKSACAPVNNSYETYKASNVKILGLSANATSPFLTADDGLRKHNEGGKFYSHTEHGIDKNKETLKKIQSTSQIVDLNTKNHLAYGDSKLEKNNCLKSFSFLNKHSFLSDNHPIQNLEKIFKDTAPITLKKKEYLSDSLNLPTLSNNLKKSDSILNISVDRRIEVSKNSFFISGKANNYIKDIENFTKFTKLEINNFINATDTFGEVKEKNKTKNFFSKKPGSLEANNANFNLPETGGTLNIASENSTFFSATASVKMEEAGINIYHNILTLRDSNKSKDTNIKTHLIQKGTKVNADMHSFSPILLADEAQHSIVDGHQAGSGSPAAAGSERNYLKFLNKEQTLKNTSINFKNGLQQVAVGGKENNYTYKILNNFKYFISTEKFNLTYNSMDLKFTGPVISPFSSLFNYFNSKNFYNKNKNYKYFAALKEREEDTQVLKKKYLNNNLNSQNTFFSTIFNAPGGYVDSLYYDKIKKLTGASKGIKTPEIAKDLPLLFKNSTIVNPSSESDRKGEVHTNKGEFTTLYDSDNLKDLNSNRELIKEYLARDWYHKIDLLKNYNLLKQIKLNLINNYFLNKVLIRKFKLSKKFKYNSNFNLNLLPYTYNLYFLSNNNINFTPTSYDFEKYTKAIKGEILNNKFNKKIDNNNAIQDEAAIGDSTFTTDQSRAVAINKAPTISNYLKNKPSNNTTVRTYQEKRLITEFLTNFLKNFKISQVQTSNLIQTTKPKKERRGSAYDFISNVEANFSTTNNASLLSQAAFGESGIKKANLGIFKISVNYPFAPYIKRRKGKLNNRISLLNSLLKFGLSKNLSMKLYYRIQINKIVLLKKRARLIKQVEIGLKALEFAPNNFNLTEFKKEILNKVYNLGFLKKLGKSTLMREYLSSESPFTKVASVVPFNTDSSLKFEENNILKIVSNTKIVTEDTNLCAEDDLPVLKEGGYAAAYNDVLRRHEGIEENKNITQLLTQSSLNLGELERRKDFFYLREPGKSILSEWLHTIKLDTQDKLFQVKERLLMYAFKNNKYLSYGVGIKKINNKNTNLTKNNFIISDAAPKSGKEINFFLRKLRASYFSNYHINAAKDSYNSDYSKRSLNKILYPVFGSNYSKNNIKREIFINNKQLLPLINFNALVNSGFTGYSQYFYKQYIQYFIKNLSLLPTAVNETTAAAVAVGGAERGKAAFRNTHVSRNKTLKSRSSLLKLAKVLKLRRPFIINELNILNILPIYIIKYFIYRIFKLKDLKLLSVFTSSLFKINRKNTETNTKSLLGSIVPKFVKTTPAYLRNAEKGKANGDTSINNFNKIMSSTITFLTAGDDAVRSKQEGDWLENTINTKFLILKKKSGLMQLKKIKLYTKPAQGSENPAKASRKLENLKISETLNANTETFLKHKQFFPLMWESQNNNKFSSFSSYLQNLQRGVIKDSNNKNKIFLFKNSFLLIKYISIIVRLRDIWVVENGLNYLLPPDFNTAGIKLVINKKSKISGLSKNHFNDLISASPEEVIENLKNNNEEKLKIKLKFLKELNKAICYYLNCEEEDIYKTIYGRLKRKSVLKNLKILIPELKKNNKKILISKLKNKILNLDSYLSSAKAATQEQEKDINYINVDERTAFVAAPVFGAGGGEDSIFNSNSISTFSDLNSMLNSKDCFNTPSIDVAAFSSGGGEELKINILKEKLKIFKKLNIINKIAIASKVSEIFNDLNYKPKTYSTLLTQGVNKQEGENLYNANQLIHKNVNAANINQNLSFHVRAAQVTQMPQEPQVQGKRHGKIETIKNSLINSFLRRLVRQNKKRSKLSLLNKFITSEIISNQKVREQIMNIKHLRYLKLSQNLLNRPLIFTLGAIGKNSKPLISLSSLSSEPSKRNPIYLPFSDYPSNNPYLKNLKLIDIELLNNKSTPLTMEAPKPIDLFTMQINYLKAAVLPPFPGASVDLNSKAAFGASGGVAQIEKLKIEENNKLNSKLQEQSVSNLPLNTRSAMVATQEKEITSDRFLNSKIDKKFFVPIIKPTGDIRKFLIKYNLMSNTGKYKVILFNFIKNFSRLNTLNSLDFTGSLEIKNISVLLKYFFKIIGGSLISKPIFIYNQNKIIIQLSYFLNKNTYFFNDSDKSKLLYLWLNNSKFSTNDILNSNILNN